jgi:hypothetical protein
MKPIHTERLGDLLLARLSCLASKPPRPDDVRKSLYAFVARELSAAEWQQLFDRTLAALRAAGSVDAERLVLTEGGRTRLTRALRLRSAPKAKTWPEFQSKYLPRLLLDPRPEYDEPVPALATVLLAQRLGVALEPRSTPAKVIDTWLARSLGLDKLNLAELRKTLLARELQLPIRPRLTDVTRLGVAQLAGATSGSPGAVLEALTSRWLHESEHHPPAQPTPAALTPARPPRARDEAGPPLDALESFAVRVRRVANSSNVRSFGPDKAFIGSVWQSLASDPEISRLGEPEFKRLLVEAHRRGMLVLDRADLVAAMDPGDVSASEITHQNATYHFIHRGQPA